MMLVLHIPSALLYANLETSMRPGVGTDFEPGLHLEQPAILLEETASGRVVLDACAEALAQGVQKGMEELRASLLCPEARLLMQKPQALQTLHQQMFEALDSLGPGAVQLDEQSFALPLEKSEDEATQEGMALQSLRLFGLHASLGRARTAFLAHQIARQTPCGALRSLQRHQESDFLKTLPLSILELKPGVHEKLNLSGFHSLGELSSISRPDLVRQFGLWGHRLYQLCRGEDLHLPKPYCMQQRFFVCRNVPGVEDPVWLYHILCEAIEDLAQQMQSRGHHALGLRICLRGAQNSLNFELRFPAPVQKISAFRSVLDLHWRQKSPPSEVLQIECEFLKVGQARSSQQGLKALSLHQKSHQKLEAVLKRMTQRGFDVARIQTRDLQHGVPEKRVFLKKEGETQGRSDGFYLPENVWVETNTEGRPVCLHSQRHGRRRIKAILNQWEVCADWWTARPIQRTYFRVLLSNGAMVRVFLDHLCEEWFFQAG